MSLDTRGVQIANGSKNLDDEQYQGGHKGPEIKENVELICKNTDKEIKEMVGDMIASQQSKNTH